MISNNEELDEYIARDKITGENVKYVRKVCKCGRSIYFLNNKSMICRQCNRRVYPTKSCEFKEKMKKEMRKTR